MPGRETLMLLPGLLCDAALWQYQMTALAEAAELRIADFTRAGASMGEFAEAVLATAPARFALAGLSMGGYIAFEILRRAPERVTRLAVLDTSARPESEEAGARRRGMIGLAATGRFQGVTPRLLPLLVHPSRVAGPVGAEVMAMAERVGAEAYRRQAEACLQRPDSRPDLPSIRVPTLVLAGEEDQVTPPALAQEIAAGIPGAEYQGIPHCGHLAPLEDPAAVNRALLDWLGW